MNIFKKLFGKKSKTVLLEFSVSPVDIISGDWMRSQSVSVDGITVTIDPGDRDYHTGGWRWVTIKTNPSGLETEFEGSHCKSSFGNDDWKIEVTVFSP